MDALALALRLTLALVCAWAAAGKVLRRADRRDTVRMLRGIGVPRAAAPSVAAALVTAELAVAVLAPPPATGLVGAGAAAALLTVLTVGVAVAVRRRAPVVCRCFGSRGTRLAGVHVTRNAGLTVLAALAVAATAAAPARLPSPPAALAAVAAALAATLLTRHTDDIAAVFRPGRPALSKGL